MIKFFRKIRQQLLKENKFTQYLFYALGEIVLVVIGILIALQINTMNENYKENQKVITYLKQFKNDLQYDTITLADMISKNEIKIRNIDAIQKIFVTKKN